MKIRKLTLADEQGNEFLCTVLMAFTNKENDKNYVLFYADGITEEEDSEQHQVMAASYTVDETGLHLENIEDDAEWKCVEETFQNQQEGNEYPDYIEAEYDGCSDEDCACCSGCGHDHDDDCCSEEDSCHCHDDDCSDGHCKR